MMNNDLSVVCKDKCEIEDNVDKKGSCNLSLKRKRALRKSFACDQCSYIGTHKTNLIKHRRKHTADVDGFLHCDKNCDFKTKKNSKLIDHMKRHKKSLNGDESEVSASTKSNLIGHQLTISPTDADIIACDKCDFKTTRHSKLANHSKTHTRPFKCTLCDYKASRKSNLLNHKMTHTGEKPFSCDTCDYKTSHKKNLSTHQERNHASNSFV